MEYRRPESLREAILFSLVYADIFDYPLTLEELHRYLIGYAIDLDDLSREVEGLIAQENGISHDGEYYFLADRRELTEIRTRRERHSLALWRRAELYGRWIANLPFVRMVAVTGALANNNVDPGGDIDFFVVTEPGHLWVSRAFIMLLTRITRPFGPTICANYLLTVDALELPERDFFTAQEFARMVPLSGREVYDAMRANNKWIQTFLPNAEALRSRRDVPPASSLRIQIWGEKILKTRFGKRLEDWERNRKVKRLAALSNGAEEADFSPQRCKGHFDHHATRTLNAFLNRTQRLKADAK